MRTLYTRHRVRVYRFALRLINDRSAADDLVTEVFMQVWRHAGKFERRSQVSTWLLAITRHLAVSMLRRRSLDEARADAADVVEDPADNPERLMQKAQDSAILSLCLKQLSQAHREIIDLVYYHEKSVNEVAEIIGVPRATVKTRMFYARNKLAKLLEGFGIDRARA